MDTNLKPYPFLDAPYALSHTVEFHPYPAYIQLGALSGRLFCPGEPEFA